MIVCRLHNIVFRCILLSYNFVQQWKKALVWLLDVPHCDIVTDLVSGQHIPANRCQSFKVNQIDICVLFRIHIHKEILSLGQETVSGLRPSLNFVCTDVGYHFVPLKVCFIHSRAQEEKGCIMTLV